MTQQSRISGRATAVFVDNNGYKASIFEGRGIPNSGAYKAVDGYLVAVYLSDNCVGVKFFRKRKDAERYVRQCERHNK